MSIYRSAGAEHGLSESVATGHGARTLEQLRHPSWLGVMAVALTVWCLPVSCPGAEEVRTWTDLSGRSFEGGLISSTATTARIRRADGKVFEVAREKLSAGDNAYLASRADAPPPVVEPEGPSGRGEAVGGPLLGYDPATANFDAAWPDSAGVAGEAALTVVEEDKAAGKYVYESEHFRFTCNVLMRPSLLSKVATMFEACHQAHHDIPFNNRRTRSPKAGKLNARLFETMEQYREAGGPPGSAGVYMGGPDVFMVPLEALGVKKVGSGYMFDFDGDFHTLYHEITHQLWADLGGMAGMWMVEGFAEYMACAPYRAGSFSFAKQPKALLSYATAFGKKDNGGRALGEEIVMAHLEEFMSWDQPTFYQDGGRNYGLGLLLTYFFINLDGKGDAARVKACIRKLQEGGNEEEARRVLLDGRSYADLEKEFAAAMRKKGIKMEFVKAGG